MEIVLSRPKQFADRFRTYQVFIDDKIVAKICAGDEVRINVPIGAEKLSATIDWCSSNVFDLLKIQENESIEIKNAFSKKSWIPFLIFFAITVGKRNYLNIEKLYTP